MTQRFVMVRGLEFADGSKERVPEWFRDRCARHVGMLAERLTRIGAPFVLTVAGEDTNPEFEIADECADVFRAQDEAVCEVFRAEDFRKTILMHSNCPLREVVVDDEAH